MSLNKSTATWKMSNSKNYMFKSHPAKMVIALIVPQLFGLLGAFFTAPNLVWYELIKLPPLTPPAWVFAPVWTMLFFLMGLGWYFVWSRRPHFWQLNKKTLYKDAIGIFFVQLVLNVFWSVIFFGLHLPGLAAVEILFLWFAILSATILFFRLQKVAGLFLAPYLLWVTYAAYLNFAIWIINH